jgi:hypothetical protein
MANDPAADATTPSKEHVSTTRDSLFLVFAELEAFESGFLRANHQRYILLYQPQTPIRPDRGLPNAGVLLLFSGSGAPYQRKLTQTLRAAGVHGSLSPATRAIVGPKRRISR